MDSDARLYRQDWEWESYKNSRSAAAWNDDKKRLLSSFKNKKLEMKMWRWKMVTRSVTTSVPERIVPERVVNVEEFRTIGIVQKFERLGWERVLDWCEDATPRIYMEAVCEWLSSLRFVNKDGLPHTWQLVGDTGRG